MTDIQTLRADFATVWTHWRATGQISPQEHDAGRHEAAAAIREHMADAGWMECCSNHFREMAEQIAREAATAERIKAEVREERERK